MDLHIDHPFTTQRKVQDQLATLADFSTVPFTLAPELEAHEPPEARGLARDEVRLMVSHRSDAGIRHARFSDLPDFLQPGDTLVLNSSATLPAAILGRRPNGEPVEVHFSTRQDALHWIVELLQPVAEGGATLFNAQAGEWLLLSGGAVLTLLAPYRASLGPAASAQRTRLWTARVHTSLPVEKLLERYGFPIRYPYVTQEWPMSYYQTVYAAEPGSAEMPSAGRPFSQPVIDRLREKGIEIASLVLHTGVSSPEEHEPPLVEPYRVPEETSQAVNRAHRARRRVIAVGTTVIRALETVTAPDGLTRAGAGWTDLLVTPLRGLRAVDGLLTGFHEPRSTHLLMIEALVRRDLIQQAYAEALQQRYLWHEFGDVHLILP
jgi:S-adenosylmethionine:tRNA ribosyltransferase-isomerase